MFLYIPQEQIFEQVSVVVQKLVYMNGIISLQRPCEFLEMLMSALHCVSLVQSSCNDSTNHVGKVQLSNTTSSNKF